MLKIECGPADQHGDSPCHVEMYGALGDNIAELLLSVRRIYNAIAQSNPTAATFFQKAIQGSINDPEYWSFEVKGKTIEQISAVFPTTF